MSAAQSTSLIGNEADKGIVNITSSSTVYAASNLPSASSLQSMATTSDAIVVKDHASDEPTAAEHRRDIAIGSLGVACLYGCVRSVVPTDADAEDVMDLAHSIYTSGVAVYGSTQMKPHPMYTKELPPHLVDGRGPVVRMFKYSLGYFAADAVYIAVNILGRGKFPDLWAGRLVHHAIQLGGSYPGIFSRDAAHNAGYRSALCAAYVAEVSSIFLRLSNMNRGSSLRVRRAINWSLAISFFGARIVNFAKAFVMVFKLKPVFYNPQQFKFIVALMGACYTMNAGWFMKIMKIAIKTK